LAKRIGWRKNSGSLATASQKHAEYFTR